MAGGDMEETDTPSSSSSLQSSSRSSVSLRALAVDSGQVRASGQPQSLSQSREEVLEARGASVWVLASCRFCGRV